MCTIAGANKNPGLEYAFLQFNKPSKWKFNKAKQNWLLRHVWSSEEVRFKDFSLHLAQPA